MPPTAGKTKTPTTAGKTPAATDNELISQDPDAVLAALERVIARSAREFARPLAPAITSISIALRELQDDAPTVDQEVSVRVYMPFNADNNGASYRRVEAEFHNLQPEEMESFVRLVRGVRAERGGHEGLDREAEQNRANHTDQRGEASKLNELRKIARDQDIALVEARTRIAELTREVEQRDDQSENDKKKTSRLERPQELLDEANVDLFKSKADNEELKEELTVYRKLIEMDGDDNVMEGTDARDSDDAEDDAAHFVHKDDPELSAEEPELSEKPVIQKKKKKPAPAMAPYTPMPKPEHDTKDDNPQHRRSARQGFKANEHPETITKPTEKERSENPKKRNAGSGVFHNGYELEYKPSKSINEGLDPEKVIRDNRRKSRQLEAKSTSDQQTPEGTAAGTSAADESADTPCGQVITGGPGRKQSNASTKARKPKNDQGSEADVDSDEGFEKPVEPVSKKKRKAETSYGEDQLATSKKPRRATKMQPVEEEPGNEDEHVRAVKGSRASSVSKAKLLHAKQSAKRKVSQNDLAESEGGTSDPIYISSGEETDSDTDDDD